MLLVGPYVETCTERSKVIISVIIGFPSTASYLQLRDVHTPCTVHIMCSQCRLAGTSPFSLLPPHPGLPSIQADTQEGDTHHWSHDAGRSHCRSTQAFTVGILTLVG